MNPQQPPTEISLVHTADYRESYANSVQVRVSLWDFFLLFGTINQSAPDKARCTGHKNAHHGLPRLRRSARA